LTVFEILHRELFAVIFVGSLQGKIGKKWSRQGPCREDEIPDRVPASGKVSRPGTFWIPDRDPAGKKLPDREKNAGVPIKKMIPGREK